MQRPRVAVLGAGIMGSSVALFAARAGADVVLFDEAPVPFSGASRWNEGKIHLGFLYAADPTLATARAVLPGGLAFRPLVEELIGEPLQGVTADDDLVLVHRDSVVDGLTVANRFERLSGLVRSQKGATGYLVDVSMARAIQLSDLELDEIADTSRITAGFRVPERSVSTTWLADRFVAALEGEDRIEFRGSNRVVGLRSAGEGLGGPFEVRVASGASDGGFDWVLNALWHGRLTIDQAVGVELPGEWSHRYRLALFVRCSRPVVVPSVVVAAGPFGDIKSYSPTEFYLSWYPTLLRAEGTNVAPPPVATLGHDERQGVIDAVFERLSEFIPAVADVRAAADEIRLEGGWVYAEASGSLGDPTATIHRRNRVGIRQVGSYLSVDTGKYSIAPWLAQKAVDRMMGL